MKTNLPRAHAWPARAAFSLLLAGTDACSALAPTPPPSPTPAEPLVLQVLTIDTPPISQVYDILTQAFARLHPEVTIIKVPLTTDPAQQIASLAQTNNVPDVI